MKARSIFWRAWTATQDSSAVNGIPGLVNIPILGKIFFGSDHTEKDSQQLMIALHAAHRPDSGLYAGESARRVLRTGSIAAI